MMSMPQPVRFNSDETEGSVLRDFVNEALDANQPNHFSDETPPSPRSELLSPGSRRDETPPTNSSSDQSQSRSRSRRGPSSRYRREREVVHSTASHRDLLRLLIETEYELTRMRKALYTAFERLESEAQRATEAERARTELVAQFRTLNENRVKAIQQASKANEELRMYQMQYNHAQAEIQRAQGALHDLREQRDDAEKSATKARRVARELNQQRLVSEAREQGRRLGFKAGFQQAQVELGMQPEGMAGNIDDALLGMEARRGEDEEDYYHDDHDDTDTTPRDDRSVARLRITEGGHAASMPEPITEPVPQPAPSAPPPSHTPSVQVYSLPIPPADQFTTPNNHSRQDLPPDNFIPPSDGGFIPIPPPHGFSQLPDYSHMTTMGTPSPNARSVTLPPIPPPDTNVLRARDYAYGTDGVQQQPGHGQRAGSIDSRTRRHSSASTSSRLSNIDLVKNPADRDRDRDMRPRPERELSVIKEDITGSASGTGVGGSSPHVGRKPSMGMGSQTSRGHARSATGTTGADSFFDASASRDDFRHQEAQHLADALRYERGEDARAAEGWRRAAHGDPRPPSRDRPPRHVRLPSKLTVPAPLSPPSVNPNTGARVPSRGHNRSVSEMSAASRGTAPNGGYQDRERERAVSITSMTSSMRRANNVTPHAGQQGRGDYLTMPTQTQPAMTPGTADINFSVQSPSGSPSETPNVSMSAQDTPNTTFLSPRHSTSGLPRPGSAAGASSAGSMRLRPSAGSIGHRPSTGSINHRPSAGSINQHPPGGSVRHRASQAPLVPTVPNTPNSVAQSLEWPSPQQGTMHMPASGHASVQPTFAPGPGRANTSTPGPDADTIVMPQYRDMQPKFERDREAAEAEAAASRPSSRLSFRGSSHAQGQGHPSGPRPDVSPRPFQAHLVPFPSTSPSQPPEGLPASSEHRYGYGHTQGYGPGPQQPGQMHPSQSQLSLNGGGGSRPSSVRSFFSLSRHKGAAGADASPAPGQQALPHLPEGLPGNAYAPGGGQGDPSLQRVKSNASIASSFKSFDRSTYLDPAFYGREGAPQAGASANAGGVPQQKSKHTRSRTVSAASGRSGLEYY
ncbi:hypothetical protein HGRIS_000194 [Hohenbuehelia grisea]|uniref:Uncharacterized protein n=1 Tax=Hohenbuehelia grisea TaxID=104357 RepID=A0ABR3JQB4_9AGAR